MKVKFKAGSAKPLASAVAGEEGEVLSSYVSDAKEYIDVYFPVYGATFTELSTEFDVVQE